MRKTPFRKEVLDIFKKSHNAISQADFEEKLAEYDRITLYRTIKTFEEKGIIHKALDGTNVTRYALCEADCNSHSHNDHHAHFHCSDCDETFCVEDVEVPIVKVPTGFQVRDTALIINGICKNCTN